MTFLLILFLDTAEAEVDMSPSLLEALRLPRESAPRTLDQWRELCDPADHWANRELDDALHMGRAEVSLTRRLYCGDGVYRVFRLDAYIQRDEEGNPRCLLGMETPVETASKQILALEEENLLLRRALQRQALRLLRADIPARGKEFVVGVAGRGGSGKSAFMNAMAGRAPEGVRLVEFQADQHVDAVLYLVPIRARLGEAERDRIRGLPGERAILLSQIDLERDDMEAGQVVLSRERKLGRAIEELTEETGGPVIPISSRLILAGQGSEREWQASNFDAVLRLLSAWAGREPAPEEHAIPRDLRMAPEETGPFAPLLFSMREEGLRSRFLALPVGRRLILLGPREESLRLFSRLLHDAAFAESHSFDRSAWLFAGQGDPPFPCLRLSRLVEGLDFLIAPSDPGERDWKSLFREWTPVVHADLAAGPRGPYLQALNERPWVLACSNGGMFDTRLEDLAVSARAWFIYENYDARYTDFPSLAGHVRPDSTDEELEALAALWGECGLGYHPPFTREALREALAKVRRRKGGI